MNAYELADELENKDRLWNVDENLMLKNCAMLRQQADRIANYEKWEKRWSERVARAENLIAELQKDLAKYDRLAWDDLNKQSDEPYCWRMKANDPNDKDWWLFGRKPKRHEKVSHSAIPLYTAPSELKQVWCDCGDSIEPDCGAICGNCLASMNTAPRELSDEEIINLYAQVDGGGILAFARAVIKKASEKC